MSDEIKKTPEEWEMEEEYRDFYITDPDGWRDPDAPSWDTPITRDEFDKRRSVSTLQRA